MASSSVSDRPPPVVLVAGEDPVLTERAVRDAVTAATEAAGGADVDVHQYSATELDAVPEMQTASLFGGSMVVVIDGLRPTLGQHNALFQSVVTYAKDPTRTTS